MNLKVVFSREMLLTFMESIDAIAGTAEPRDRTLLKTLREALEFDINRRADLQKKRRAAGFTDDPDGL